jgi:alkylhydroperoxidase family enzyme
MRGVDRPGWLQRLVSFLLKRRHGKVPDSIALLGHHPRILAAFMAYGAFFDSSKELSARLKRLAHLRVAMRVGCPS